ncbi:MAG TPA: hypothetical protein VNR11_01640 [Xanthobacteraceae bacterium]|nr:hypothetical protein [Xanthobacteraceae bacterium]
MTVADEKKEIRTQRHDFIKEYYKMATLDLDRHLKAGWQTIAVLAGGAAILTAGHDGKIGLPIAVAIALISAFWGVLTVIDANYWSVRAIAFLSNVEAVYFSTEDRAYFNPYIGHHPPLKLLNSLRYMFWLCVLFGAMAVLSLLWEISQAYPTAPLIWAHVKLMRPLRFFLWSIPFLVSTWGWVWAIAVYRKRIHDYHQFSVGSPGPGVRLGTFPLRHVTLDSLEGEPPVRTEDGTNAKMQQALQRSERIWKQLAYAATVVASLFTVAVTYRVLCGT